MSHQSDRDPQDKPYPDSPQYPTAETGSKAEISYESMGTGIETGLDLIYGELLPLTERRAGEEVANEMRELVVPYVKELKIDEPIRVLIALEELAAVDMLDADRASEMFHTIKEGLVIHPAWQKRHGQESARLADARVRGLIARSKFQVTTVDGGHRPYAVTDLVRYEKDLNQAA